MVKYILYIIFMIPIFYLDWFFIQFMFLFLLFLFSLNKVSLNFMLVSYVFGVDFLSYGLIMLSIFICSLVIISMDKIKMSYNYMFLFVNLFLCLILILIFCSLNMIIMYMYFELSLIPLLIMIFGWGYQPERLMAGLYMFFYTLLASLPLFLLLVYFNKDSNTLFFTMEYNFMYGFMVHLCLIISFLVKLPMFMLHFWLPKAHVQAPVCGSMILAGLLLKIGGYGIIRFMFIFEYLFFSNGFIWYSLSMIGSLLVSLLCLIQGDMKCMIAYSSVAHMGLCLMGMMTMSYWGILSSFLVMLAHGLCSSGLFCMANIFYQRISSRSFFLSKGVVNFMPSMCMLWFFLCMFNMGCPPSLNFFSEVYLLVSIMSYWNNFFFFFFFF